MLVQLKEYLSIQKDFGLRSESFPERSASGCVDGKTHRLSDRHVGAFFAAGEIQVESRAAEGVAREGASRRRKAKSTPRPNASLSAIAVGERLPKERYASLLE